MLHIRPVTEEDASEKLKATYADIKKTLTIHFVPLIFQYIAGFEEYFLYAWEKYKKNIESDFFRTTVAEIIDQSQKSVAAIYRESKDMQQFLAHISIAEKEEIRKTVGELQLLNAQLLILSIGLREGVKGVVIGQHVLPTRAENVAETIFDQFINEKIMHANLREMEKDIAPASKMLAPLFGNQSLVVVKYPQFFGLIAKEMENLAKTEKYLHERVRLEQLTLMKSLILPYPLGCSYAEIATFAGKKPYFSELLYILSETFPTSFPRLVFTSAVMQFLLHPQGRVDYLEKM